jgi:PAS domain S-box-containing protein
LAENIDTVFWVTELAQWRVSYVSPACERLWGVNPQNICDDRQTWIDLLHPDDRAATSRAFQEKAIEGTFDEEYRIVLPDGRMRWVRDRCFPLHDASGKVYRLTGIAEDITDRKQVQEALRESQALFEAFMRYIPATAYIKDEEGRYLYVNPLNEQICNRPIADWLGKTDFDLFGLPEAQQWHQNDLISLAANGAIEVVETYQPGDGERYFLSYKFPIQLSAERRLVAGLSLDITDRKQAEAVIAANEARLRGFFEANVVGMLYGDSQGNIHEANDELLRIVGYTREDLRAGRLCWIDITPAEYLPLDELAIAQARANGACTPYEKEFSRKDGSRVPVLLGYSLVGEAREESVAFILDLTDRKQAEREAQEGKQILDALMEYVPEGITIADAPDVSIRRVSRYGQQLMGRPLEAIEGIPVAEHAQKWDIFYADGITPASNEVLPLTRAVQQGEIVTNEEWVLRRPDGTKITVLCNAGPIYVNGTITGGAIVWRDITDRVQFERERDRILQQEQAARTEAERANRIKDEFLAVLSHELRSPLNPILGWTKLMQTHKFDAAKTAQALATIERNAKLQTQLIDDLLDVAKILRGKLSMNVAPVNLVFVIESAIETVRAAAIAKSILLHPMLPNIGQVSGDAARLQQIVWNLLSNAVKFTPTGGRVEIRLSLVSDRPPPVAGRSPMADGKQLITKYAQITVSDTGKGINPDFLPHIFESFRQEDASTSRKYGGLGLGLAIVRSLVEAHGGTIWARSQGEGRGATFTVQLPLLDLEVSQKDESIAQEEEPDLTGIRVLTVDDEPDTRELFAVLLAQYGAEVLSVASAAEVLTSLESFQPDVLLSDIGMPDIDGYALIQQVRALPPERGGQVVAIALTAYAREEDRQRTLAAGFQHHICKPIDPAKLAMVLWQLLKSTA